MATSLSNMKGKFARVAALSPRPEGVYRFSVKMKAETPMPVTVEALGVWASFDVTGDWEHYEVVIDEPSGDNIDLYPLSDDILYVEEMQLNYGKAAHEWRPAPEDEVTYDWTCIAIDEATLTNVKDFVSYTEYYYLADAGASAPVRPTTNPPPSPWAAEAPMSNSYAATVSVSGNISAAAVTASTFASAVGGATGVYRITYDGTSWKHSGQTISLQDYGVVVSGTPAAGDSIAVTLRVDTDRTMYKCAVTVYSDETFSWGDVTTWAAYDAALAAIRTSTYYQTQVEQLLDSWTATVRATTVNDETQETVSDLLGRIQVTESTVSNLIDETRRNSEGLGERITSLQTQTSADITNTFTEAKEYAKEYADDQYGGTRDYVVTAQSWQRFSAEGIEQGKLGSPFKSKLSSTELGFYEDEQRVAYINNNKLKITNGEIIESLVIGNFEFISNDEGLGIIFNGSGGS